jgi:hypothetical protein
MRQFVDLHSRSYANLRSCICMFIWVTQSLIGHFESLVINVN